jgi:hypothetical protein
MTTWDLNGCVETKPLKVRRRRAPADIDEYVFGFNRRPQIRGKTILAFFFQQLAVSRLTIYIQLTTWLSVSVSQ